MTRSPVVVVPSERVANVLSIDAAVSACDGLAAVMAHRIRRRPSEGESRFLDVYAGDRHVQVCISPSGRSVRVFVNGQAEAVKEEIA